MTNYEKHADEKGFTLPRWTIKEYAALPGDVIRHLVYYSDPESDDSQFDLDCRLNAWLVADRLNTMQEKYRWLIKRSPFFRSDEVSRALYEGQG